MKREKKKMSENLNNAIESLEKEFKVLNQKYQNVIKEISTATAANNGKMDNIQKVLADLIDQLQEKLARNDAEESTFTDYSQS